jgi:Amt family ammonium transporter
MYKLLLSIMLATVLATGLGHGTASAQESAATTATESPAGTAPPASAATEVATPAPTAPLLVSTATISAGDTAWMLTSTALVLLMTVPGLALFYAGMVRKKNVLSTLMQSFAITCVATLLWWLIGYSWAFTPGNGFLGGNSRFLMNGMTFMFAAKQLTVSHLALTIPETVYSMFQMTFAIITPALICGAFAERMKFSAMLIFMSVWSLVVYAPIAHWVWEPSGWLAARGILDYAGGTVVHINAGIAALVCALVLGKRVGYGREAMPPHNLVLTVIGASLLWVGWFGFNAGSAVAADGRAGMAMMATQVATAAAAMSWMFAEWIFKHGLLNWRSRTRAPSDEDGNANARVFQGKPSVLGIASGAVAGLVAITPASGFVGPTGAAIIGLIAGIVCYVSATSLKQLLGYDDSLDAFGVHCVGGIVGALLTGVLSQKEISGLDASFTTQLLGVSVTLIYSGTMSFIILKVIDWTVGLRVSIEEEREGLDVALHGERIE